MREQSSEFSQEEFDRFIVPAVEAAVKEAADKIRTARSDRNKAAAEKESLEIEESYVRSIAPILLTSLIQRQHGPTPPYLSMEEEVIARASALHRAISACYA